jgi:L-alanine-DL-glutamate epimerase-like enolase superfamily enzyme
MLITDVRVTVVRQNLAKAFWTAEVPIVRITETVVEVFTDEGIVGFGESTRGNPEKSGRVTLDLLRPLLLGRNALESAALWEKMFSLTHWAELPVKGFSRFDVMNALAAVDIALWDIKGKAANMPVYKLLGGSDEPRPFYSTAGYYDDALTMEERAQELGLLASDLGATMIKIKIGRNLDEDVKWVALARKVLGPHVGLMLDANLGYDVRTAIEAGKRFSEFDILWLEEPVHWYDRYKGLGIVAAAQPIPLHAGESEDHRFECRDLVVDGRITYCSFDASRACGVTEWLRVANFCEIHNVRMAPHGQPLIHAHLSAAVRNATMVEVHPDPVRHPLWDHGYVDRAVAKDNHLHFTDKPGFGIEISPDYLKKYGTRME